MGLFDMIKNTTPSVAPTIATPTPTIIPPTTTVVTPIDEPTKEEPKDVVVKPTTRKAKVVETHEAPTDVDKPLFLKEWNRSLRKVELWFGNPSTGKTTLARALCEKWKEEGVIDDYGVIYCDTEMTFQNILKTTTTDDEGRWKFPLNRVFDFLTDKLQRRYIIILDEVNVLPAPTLKAAQPYLDDTVGTFDFDDKVYVKNPNVNFVLTMNHNDLGINRLPDAIRDRAFPKFFADIDVVTLSKWTGVPQSFIELLEKIYNMFNTFGELPKFYRSARQLKFIKSLTRDGLFDYITSQLELASIEWTNVVKISPEFSNLLDEYEKISW